MLCDVCKHGMREVESVNSGNAVFKTFQCMHCANRKTSCEGFSQI